MTRKLLDPIPPGEILQEEFMKPMGISINALSRDINVPPNRISEIVNGKRSNALLNLPIVAVAEDKKRGAHIGQIVALVEKMLALHQQLAAAKTPQDTNLLQRQIDATDKQIDQLVHQLYGLTDEEVSLVESAK